MHTFALDFESYYDKQCSIKTLGPRGYFSHPDFDAYLVSVVGDEGTRYDAHPKDFDWSLLAGARVVSHNASFDEALYHFGVEQGWWPKVAVAEWHCTADLVAYCGLPRSLAAASAAQWGLLVEKTTRDNMSGKQWASMSPEFQAEVRAYALKDADLCLRLWQELADQWPEHERAVSRVNREALFRGIPVDLPALKKALETINTKLHEAEAAIPWAGEKPLLSRKAFNDACRAAGITPPKSLDKRDAAANEWLRVNSFKYPWVAAVRNWRSINALKKKLEAFDQATMPDGRYYGGLMYFGANMTGRFSGSSANLNLQNLPAKEMFGVDMRGLLAPAPGFKFLAVDLSQIEVRTLCWLANDQAMLRKIAASDDIYHAFAVAYGWWSDDRGPLREHNKTLRDRKVKPTTLACGFQVGPQKLVDTYGMSLPEAEDAVRTYRRAMLPVVRLWNHYGVVLHNAWVNGGVLALGLPSGRVITYGEIKAHQVERSGRQRIEYYALILKNGKRTPCKLYPGHLTENLAQALARDIFSDHLRRIAEAGYKILFHVHDEVVLEVPAATAEADLAAVLQIMHTPPTWIPNIPLAAEGKVLDRYGK